MSETKISRLKTLGRRHREQLSALGIETVEELLSRSHGEAKAKSVAGHLKLSTEALETTLEEGRRLVSADFLAELEQPVKRNKRGALIPPSADVDAK